MFYNSSEGYVEGNNLLHWCVSLCLGINFCCGNNELMEKYIERVEMSCFKVLLITAAKQLNCRLVIRHFKFRNEHLTKFNFSFVASFSFQDSLYLCLSKKFTIPLCNEIPSLLTIRNVVASSKLAIPMRPVAMSRLHLDASNFFKFQQGNRNSHSCHLCR